MGRLGYQSEAQAQLAVSYNSMDSYADSLHDALTRPYAAYEKIGIRNLGGEYNQLATTLLQIENEFYGTIRPKRVIKTGERPLHALRERGVEYIEVRCMDLDPFEPVGINFSDREVERVGATRTGVAYCPISHEYIGLGVMRLRDLRDAGAVVGLGLRRRQRASPGHVRADEAGHPAAAGGDLDPTISCVEEVFELATREGARYLGSGAGVLRAGEARRPRGRPAGSGAHDPFEPNRRDARLRGAAFGRGDDHRRTGGSWSRAAGARGSTRTR